MASLYLKTLASLLKGAAKPHIAAFKTFVYSDSPDSFKYYHFVDAENEDEFNAYVEKCRELSLYDTGVSAEYGDKLISLSTCEYSRTNGRLVVVAKLVK